MPAKVQYRESPIHTQESTRNSLQLFCKCFTKHEHNKWMHLIDHIVLFCNQDQTIDDNTTQQSSLVTGMEGIKDSSTGGKCNYLHMK